MDPERDCSPMMLCTVLGFMPAIHAAMRARPDIPRAAFVLAAQHQHPSLRERREPLTAADVVRLAEHFHCVEWLERRASNG